jgi:hypothetical protein
MAAPMAQNQISTGRIFTYISSAGFEILLWVVTQCSSEKSKQENSKNVSLSASWWAHFRTLKKAVMFLRKVGLSPNYTAL